MTTITNELRKAVLEARGLPIQVVDPDTNERYFLVKADVYERFQSLLNDSPLTRDEQIALLQQAGKRAGWDDPEMDIYDSPSDQCLKAALGIVS